MRILLQKMQTSFADPVQYFLDGEGERVALNELIGKNLEISFTGNIFCESCESKIKKTYSGGYCYKCFMSLAECDMCIMKPELCHFDKGTCRDNEFALKHCMIPHVVYIADTSDLKVGITRAHQKLTRWMDQGANCASAFWSVETRKDSGVVESFLRDFIADKTNWRNMLKGECAEEDIEYKKEELIGVCEEADLPGEPLEEESFTQIKYPVLEYPEKVSSVNLEKEPKIKAQLTGIRGQYLYFGSQVLNVRSHGGYETNWEWS